MKTAECQHMWAHEHNADACLLFSDITQAIPHAFPLEARRGFTFPLTVV